MSGAVEEHPTNAADAAAAAAAAVPSPAPPPHEPRGRLLSFRHLNALAAAAVLASTGMVSPADVSFAALSVPYVYLLSSSSFPPTSASSSPAPVFGRGNRLLSAYVSAAALVGLLLPGGYILHGVLAGDKEGIKAAAPHVFLLACQIFMEGVTFNRRFSLPMRAFVPIFFNAKRLITISEWLAGEIAKEEVEGSGVRVSVGRGLAVANMIFWGFNLFGFLLPVYLPRALKRHYGVEARF
ncbi:uncharacterized protein M6B38_259430 [Iris pallida]|uniref:DUF7733 domain-containing protein n=1 Tax=Iris pallida TaxID=29817 RepID=A0AAX6IEQ7_IRIPA|nr:uncharacterized protein M6B38_259430 [Iris pallida]